MDLHSFPSIGYADVAWVTETEMVEIDRIMIEDLDIGLIQMMENAGRNLARAVLDAFSPETVVVAAGSGGNGGGGMVAARHLANAGVGVTVATSRTHHELRGVPARQLGILQRMGVPISSDIAAADVAIDALVGYSLKGPPRGPVLELVDQLGSFDGPVVSLDTPSGLDVTTGRAPGAAVSAELTMTLALPKVGLRDTTEVGELLLADISVPREVTRRYGPGPPDFRASPILRFADSEAVGSGPQPG
jgi:NAD(P)H-hydrate epimerase